MYSKVPKGNRFLIFLRVLNESINANLAISVIKYLSLTFYAVLQNMRPFAVILLSAIFLKTKIEFLDIKFCLICLAAVSLVIMGYKEKEKSESSGSI